MRRRSRRRLLSGVTCQRASARSSCRGGSGPPALLSRPGGSSRRDAAKARCAPTAKMPLHRKTHAALAAARRGAGMAAARARASNRTNVVASGAHRPPRVRVAPFALGGVGQGNARAACRAREAVHCRRLRCVGHLGWARQGSCLPAARFVRPMRQPLCTPWPAHAPGGWLERQEPRLWRMLPGGRPRHPSAADTCRRGVREAGASAVCAAEGRRSEHWGQQHHHALAGPRKHGMNAAPPVTAATPCR